jgi:hypothetical protein
MGRYAANTTVGVNKSKAEIERTLTRYGATEFAYMTGQDKAMVGFLIDRHKIQITIGLPPKEDFEFTNNGRKRIGSAILAEWEKACRQRWRALALVIKAKLEAVECGITSMQDEFLAFTVLPSGQTIGEVVSPRIENILKTGKILSLLPEGKKD